MADDVLRRALEAEELAKGPDDSIVLRRMHELAENARRLGRGGDANRYLERIVSTIERTLGPEHADLHTPLLMLGIEAKSSNRPDKAREYLERAARIADAHSVDVRLRILAHLMLGSVEATLMRIAEANEQFRTADQLARAHLPLVDPLRESVVKTIQEFNRET